MPRGPIFLVGPMGSGTTLLRLVLDSHPHIAVPQETGFMRAYKAHVHIPFKWSGRNWAKRMGWSREELDAELSAFYDRIFMRYVEQQGKQRWGEKCPLHTWHIDDMARLYPEAQFVGIVRHPSGSVASNMSRWEHSLTRSSFHYQRYTKELARQAARHPDRFVVLRYEDLVLRPEPVLRELLEWLGEPWSEQVLQHHDVQATRGGKELVEGRNRVTDPIDVSRIDKWTRTLEPAAQRKVAKRLGRLGEFFGYDAADAAVLEPIGGDGRLLVRGAEMAARIERFSDLDVATQEPVPKPERIYHPRELRLAEAKPPPGGAAAPPRPPSAPRRAARRIVRRLPRPARRRLSAAARAVRRRVGG